MLIAEVINQMAVVGELGSSPGNLPMPGCFASTMPKISSSDPAPTLLATVALSNTTTMIISTSFTPAANAAERMPATNTNAIMSSPARMVAALLEMALSSVSCTINPRLTNWIWTYTISEAIPIKPVITPSQGASKRAAKKSACVTSLPSRPAFQIRGINQYPTA